MTDILAKAGGEADILRLSTSMSVSVTVTGTEVCTAVLRGGASKCGVTRLKTRKDNL